MAHLQQICKFRRWIIGQNTVGHTTVDITLPEGGTHRVTIIIRRDSTGMVTAFFFTDVCHESEIDDPADLLKDGGRMNHAGFAILNDRLIVMDTQIEQTADIEEIAAILFHLASYAQKYQERKTWKGKTDGPSLGKMLGGPRKKPGQGG